MRIAGEVSAGTAKEGSGAGVTYAMIGAVMRSRASGRMRYGVTSSSDGRFVR